MISAVLDTNVLAPALRGVGNPANPLGELLRKWRVGHFQLVVSEHILAELARTLDTPYFSRSLSVEEREQAILLLADQASYTGITEQVEGVATHPEDDLVLATAVSGEADYLVTGDAKLQDLGDYRGVRIISPREFLHILESEDGT